MKTYSKLTFCSLFLALIFSSCYNDNKEEVYQNQENLQGCDTANVSYATHVSQILSESCTSGCHSGTTPAANLDLTEYNQVKNSATEIVNRINGRGSLMPQGGPKLADCKIIQIETWVADGAPNN